VTSRIYNVAIPIDEYIIEKEKDDSADQENSFSN
jgi:hypothetical protein